MKENTQPQPKQNGKSNYIAAICISVFKTGIFIFFLLIYWKGVSSTAKSPYTYYLKGIGVCAFGIVLVAMVRSMKNGSKHSVNTFSVKEARKDRLIGEIMVLETAAASLDDSPEKTALGEKIKKARVLALEYKFEESWDNYLNAQYLLVKLTDNFGRKLQARARLILIESVKIKSDWRVSQIKMLLGPDVHHLNQVITPDDISKAMAIRNDYYLTRSHRMNLHRVNVSILTSAIALILTIILLLASSWDFRDLYLENFSRTILICGLFGALGAGFSFGRTLFSYNPETSRIPEQLLDMTVTFTRFAIGASAAIIILMLLKADFLKETFPEPIFPYAHVVFSFVAGFSERWVVSLLGSVIK